jgi:hypothetical protein
MGFNSSCSGEKEKERKTRKALPYRSHEIYSDQN